MKKKTYFKLISYSSRTMAKKSSDTYKDPSGLPKHQDEQKLLHEQVLASQRVQQNGQSILTMWALIQAFANSRSPVFLYADCKLILDGFKQFTCLTPQQFSDEDRQFLSDFLKKFIESKEACFRYHFSCEKFFESFWVSQEFLSFEEKFATRVVLPVIQTTDRNFHQISDKLGFFEKLVKFSKLINVTPSSDQLVSGFYYSTGLSKRDGEAVSSAERAAMEAKRKTCKAYDKLTASNAQLSSLRLEKLECMRAIKERTDFITRQLDFEIIKNANLESKIAELQLLLKAFEQQKAQELPICCICNDFTIHGSDQKVVVTNCCGYPFHDKCLDDHLRHFPNRDPPCPYCRQNGFVRGHLSGNHPLLRQPDPVKRVDAEISVCESDFLEEIFEEIEAIPQASHRSLPKSPYTSLLEIHLNQLSKTQGSAAGDACMRRNA